MDILKIITKCVKYSSIIKVRNIMFYFLRSRYLHPGQLNYILEDLRFFSFCVESKEIKDAVSNFINNPNNINADNVIKTINLFAPIEAGKDIYSAYMKETGQSGY
ncbi:MAG: hypothetical protein FWG57_00130 [Endomicrobia bacterium]|nr:hypothetical protein [Endomicrobiia bacterium]